MNEKNYPDSINTTMNRFSKKNKININRKCL